MASPFQTPRASRTSSTAPGHSKHEQAFVRNGKGDLTDDLVESGLLHYLPALRGERCFLPSQSIGPEPQYTRGERPQGGREIDTEMYQEL